MGWASRVAQPFLLAFGMGLGLLLAACDKNQDARLLVVVTANGTPAGVTALNVTLNSVRAGTSAARYTRPASEPILFPTTLSATLPPHADGEVTVSIAASDAAGATVATGRAAPVTIRAGERQTAYVQLACNDNPCIPPGNGGPGGDGGVPDPEPSCGNGRVDPGETCDTAIGPRDPGACPPNDCEDHVACTRNVHKGSACTSTCEYETITAVTPGDGCCPARKRHVDDPDCSPTCGNGMIEPGETCDTAILMGLPGACPDAMIACSDADACARELLVSEGTCSAVCVRLPVTAQPQAATTPDGCCPVGASNTSDVDCPVRCGNGITEVGESCDVGILAPGPGSCPASCDDRAPSTTDFVTGTSCQAACVHLPISTWRSGDGFCETDDKLFTEDPTSIADIDCPAQCGNGIIERGEACDRSGVGPIACPATCPPSPSACLKIQLIGDEADCSARCLVTEVTACARPKDGCCPAGCTFATDGDCSLACGDGAIQTTLGEKCDLAIPAGQTRACPTSCSSSNPCIEARLLSAGTCAAVCVDLPVTGFRAGDGCCPPGGSFTVDADCTSACGNGIVESPVETCDRAIGHGSCPADVAGCPPAGACTTRSYRGSVATCTAECITEPITACRNQDGCCPVGCSAVTDNDCPVVCGNGVRDAGESCDRGITAGAPDSCPRSCDDGNACTADVVSGTVEGCTRTCTHRDITACLAGDGCCPAGCSAATDMDCAPPMCGDRRLSAGETCDPPESCPTSCPSDGDPCTRDQLVGDPNMCDAACRHLPITACSGNTTDSCCPTGCGVATDSDC